MKLKIANGDIGEAQRNPCNIQLLPSYEVNIESCQPEGVFQVKKNTKLTQNQTKKLIFHTLQVFIGCQLGDNLLSSSTIYVLVFSI